MDRKFINDCVSYGTFTLRDVCVARFDRISFFFFYFFAK